MYGVKKAWETWSEIYFSSNAPFLLSLYAFLVRIPRKMNAISGADTFYWHFSASDPIEKGRKLRNSNVNGVSERLWLIDNTRLLSALFSSSIKSKKTTNKHKILLENIPSELHNHLSIFISNSRGFSFIFF